ncbi:leucine-rich repeat flightless-interacting protein 2 isoform X2 [Onthophagus taurus]|uniref:leucine-rich repeat flightless-interacting protein 2 isoform X2 n=1 Tax=Onthophagus taurus TaxID=166361 RepID=UPI0039BE24CD
MLIVMEWSMWFLIPLSMQLKNLTHWCKLNMERSSSTDSLEDLLNTLSPDTDENFNIEYVNGLQRSREPTKPHVLEEIGGKLGNLEKKNIDTCEAINPNIIGDCEKRDNVDFNGGSKQLKTSRSQSVCSFVEDDVINQFLDKTNENAEARMLAKRQARAEAREYRMRELERQQKEQEENADRQFDMLTEPIARAARTTSSRYMSSRRSSEDSLEDAGSIRELKHELKEVEEKFRKAMVANAQLDNDKAAQTYQLELLKDRLEELEEEHSQLRREHRDKCREHDQLKRLNGRLNDDLAVTKAELEERDRLITEKGLIIVGEEEVQVNEQPVTSDAATCNGLGTPKRALVSVENAQLLEAAGEGSLDVRLARFAKEKSELQDQISHLRLELEEERSKRRKSNASGITLNGPTSEADFDMMDMQREVSKQLAEYKFRSQKAEQDVATLQANVARLESQVIRYKAAAEMSEKSEEALKSEKRKLQREDSLNTTASSFDDESICDDSRGSRSDE